MTNPARIFVIGDVHGCATTLRHLVEQTLRPTPADRICLLGDLIDRGPDSKGVLDFIFELHRRGLSVASVRGNHEEICLKACKNPTLAEQWLANGGSATLASFKAATACDIPPLYQKFLASLPYYLLLDTFVIVHAGLNFDQNNPFDDTSAMLWSRSNFVDRQRIGGRRLVCGHTTTKTDDIMASLTENKIMLDNGCVFTGRPDMGKLAALELGSMTLHFQHNLDVDGKLI